MKLTFSCKDELLARYYSRKFKADFESQAAMFPQLTEPERVAVYESWKMAMLEEAARQEHYDWDEVNDGDGFHRVPKLGRHGRKLLLIPEIDVDLT